MLEYCYLSSLGWSGCGTDLALFGTPDLLLPVLPLLPLLLGDLGDGHEPLPDKSVLGLELLGKVEGVVDQSKSSCLTTLEVGSESKGEDKIWGGLVHLGNLFFDFRLWDSSSTGVKDVNDLHMFRKLEIYNHKSSKWITKLTICLRQRSLLVRNFLVRIVATLSAFKK